MYLQSRFWPRNCLICATFTHCGRADLVNIVMAHFHSISLKQIVKVRGFNVLMRVVNP